MNLRHRAILDGAVTLVVGLSSAGFGLAYLVISAYHPWPDFPWVTFWGHPEVGILFVAGGMLAYGEGSWMIRSRLDRPSKSPSDFSNPGLGDDRA